MKKIKKKMKTIINIIITILSNAGIIKLKKNTSLQLPNIIKDIRKKRAILVKGLPLSRRSFSSNSFKDTKLDPN
jgi:hypothetical protein